MSDTFKDVNNTSLRFEDIVSEQQSGMTLLRSKRAKPRRRVFYLNSYGMANAWRLIKQGTYPAHHLWGCLELARMGYEIAMPEEPDRNSRFFNYRRQDFKHLAFIKRWLGRDGIVYSAHTILFWTPLLASLNLLRNPVVTMLYARGENLRFKNGYTGVIGLTPAAESRARSLATKAKVAYLGWGADLSFYPSLAYEPKWFLSCGRTCRDFQTLGAAASLQPSVVRVVDPPGGLEMKWPSQTVLFTGDRGQREVIDTHYAGCSASMIILQSDSEERYGAGFTQLLEAMALARPVIVTRTGGLASEIDVEKEGCGLNIPPNDPQALAEAMKTIAADPVRAEAMGRAGRRLCETRYDNERYSRDLHNFFESL